jgi:hypothetical protein
MHTDKTPSSLASAVVRLFDLARASIPEHEREALKRIRDTASCLDAMESYTIPTISTAHLSEGELLLLEGERLEYPGVWVSMTAATGMMLCFNEPEEAFPEHLLGQYKGITALAAFAKQHRLDYIRLDPDANAVDGLPIYEH